MTGKRFCLFLICLLFTAVYVKINAQSKTGNPSKPDTSKYTIDNCISTFSMDNIEKKDNGYQFWYINKDFASGKAFWISVVEPHSAIHPPHVHSEDEIIYILEGTADVFMYGQWRTIGPNTTFYCPSNVLHGIKNSGETVLKYIATKTYPAKIEKK